MERVGRASTVLLIMYLFLIVCVRLLTSCAPDYATHLQALYAPRSDCLKCIANFLRCEDVAWLPNPCTSADI